MWADMKRRVQLEGFRELLEKIQQLKMEAADGKTPAPAATLRC